MMIERAIAADSSSAILVEVKGYHAGLLMLLKTFENSFNLKKLVVALKGKTEFPTLNNSPKVIFSNNIKKKRPVNLPDCYLSKVFVQA